MSFSNSDKRHLNRPNLVEYLSLPGPSVVKIEGSPVVYLSIDPQVPRLSLRTPQAKNTLPNIAELRNLSTAVIHWDAQNWCQISVEGSVVLDAFPIVYAIADRIQLEGMEFSSAVEVALESLRELLADISRMTVEQEVGLFGELVVLEHITGALDPSVALNGWRGPLAEEHDFDIGVGDLEIKTTLSEERHHWINSLSQLVPTTSRALWLLSIQLTTGGTSGRTLAELIIDLESKFTEHDLVLFRQRLTEAGWRSSFITHPFRKMRLRSSPSIFLVDGSFPCITRNGLAILGVSEHLLQLRYQLDLTRIVPANEAPLGLNNICLEAS